jgi:hypothetical protein
MEKAKQCLREKPTDVATTSSIGDTDTEEKPASLKRTNDVIQKSLSPCNLMLSGSSSVEEENRNVATVSPPSPSQISSAPLLTNVAATAPSSLPFMMAGGNPSNYFPGDARLLLFQSNPLVLRQQILSQQQSLASSLLPNSEHESSSQSYQAPLARSTVPYRPASSGIVPSLQERLNELRRSVNAILDNSTQTTTYREPPSTPSAPATPQPSNRMDSAEVEAEDVKVAASETASSGEKEDDVAAFLLSSLALSDRPVITEEQEALERATLSDAEKAIILADFFGIYCSESVRHNKKARKDLDQASLAFLVKLMRADLDSIPVKEKPALVEAMAKARPEEFSDERLEKFLRCEGMNTKLAAQRFVRYWEGRREVFGDDKYLLRMRLDEALKDDLTALEAGMCCVLPKPDLSGRQLLYISTKRHTREGYTSSSMLRAIWYVFEVAIQQNTDIVGGAVQISWVKGASLFDYDLKVYDKWAALQAHSWPTRVIASHICCAPRIITRLVKPIIHSFTDKRTRTRSLMHDESPSEIVGVLSKYGITKDMLPSEMGGTIQNHQLEWIADRRAIELEEI